MRPARHSWLAFWFLFLFAVSHTVESAEPTHRDLEYAKAGSTSLKLDLYLPPERAVRPVIVWIHGGAWRSGSKSDAPITPMLAAGFAIASVDYRLSPEAPFPAQIHDIKAAIRYLRANCDRFQLDLYLPKNAKSPFPVIVWVHGGGWSGGSKAKSPAVRFVARGFVVASINYRLSQHAIFPAQIHDCKAAVRWLRAHAEEYGLDRDRFAAWGSSAGGQLVALMGTTNGVEELEGNLGVLDQSSDIQAVVDWFGPTDFLTVGPKETRTKLLGGDAQQNKEQARRASPISHVSTKSVPHLIMHGDQDTTVPISQSETFADALKAAGVDATFVKIEGAAHGGPLFNGESSMKHVEDFLSKHLTSHQPAGK